MRHPILLLLLLIFMAAVAHLAVHRTATYPEIKPPPINVPLCPVGESPTCQCEVVN